MQIMAKNAWKTVAVMDSTKLNRLAKKQVFPLMKTPLILMDNQVTSEDKQIYLRAGIRIE
jgi:DeoR/GlpR family transcriptional regulator of sugar metabolism